MAKFCGRCGARLDEKNGLCPNCDAEKIKELVEKPTEQPNEIEKQPETSQAKDVPLSRREARKTCRADKKVVKKERKAQKKAAKRAKKKEKWAAKTFWGKIKSILFVFIAWVLAFAILSVLIVGLLVYCGFLDIPIVEDTMDYIGVEIEVQDVERNNPETNLTDFSFYQSSEKNIVEDAQNGFIYINNEILVTLVSQDHRHDLDVYLNTIGGSVVGEIPEIAEYQILLDKECTYAQLMKYVDTLEQFDWVVSSSPNYALEIDAHYTPNDEKWRSKWGDFPEGINWGVEAIDADEAWEYRGEMERINVGVIDTMFDLNHEDLFFAETPLGTTEITTQMSQGTQEWNNHGSHTAGTIAASFDSKKGIAGVSTGSNLYGVSIWGLETSGYSSLQAWKVSFYYLIAVNDCKAINVSMGYDHLTFEASRGGKIATSVLKEYGDEIGKFLRSLIDLDYEFVICKSAGNQNEVGGGYQYFKKDSDDTNTPYEYYSYSDYLSYLKGEKGYEHFARYKDRQEEIKRRTESGNVDADFDFMGLITDPEVKDRIIVVGAVKNLGTHKEGGFLWFGRTTVHDGYEIAAFSQCGSRVDVLAPGVDIYSTIKNGYQKMSGTSMAAPHATGVAALVFAINPDLDGKSVKDIICDTAVGQYGSNQYGLLNAENAVESAVNYNTSDNISDDPSDQEPIRTTSDERDIVLVLDVSGSMSGTPMAETKKASVNFIDTILDEDASIGIVTYDNSASMLSDFSVNEAALMTTVTSIYDGGGTNIESGLAQARSMLSTSSAKKKIIVLMSDGEPNDGKEGDDLIAYADDIKDDGIIIYTLGFFESLGSYKSSAQILMEGIASDGCHYEVASADDLVFFFEDVADQINGQKYIYIRIACPVDVTVTHKGETLSSAEDDLNVRTDFGTLTFEDNENVTNVNEDDRIKILRLKEDVDYDIQIVGTGRGLMDYTIGFMDEDGEYSDLRRFENIRISKTTVIDTIAGVSGKTVLNVDQDGDGKYDIRYRAEENGYGEEIKSNIMLYVGIGAGTVVLIMLIIIVHKISKIFKKKAG